MQLYRIMVCHHLEVSNLAWYPKLKQDIAVVPESATRQILGFTVLDYPQRLKILGLPTLIYRRLHGDVIETNKILNRHYDQEVAPELPICSTTTRGHNKKLFGKRGSGLNCRKYFFTMRVISVWHSLSEEVVNTKTVDAFKRQLGRDWKGHPVRLWKQPLCTSCMKHSTRTWDLISGGHPRRLILYTRDLTGSHLRCMQIQQINI